MPLLRKKKKKKPITYSDIEKGVKEHNENKGTKNKMYVSRTKLRYCKNDNCNNKRRAKSAYCGKCNF